MAVTVMSLRQKGSLPVAQQLHLVASPHLQLLVSFIATGAQLADSFD